MLKRCEDTKLALNWEKSHFMVKECIVLGHKISKKGIEVDKAKIEVISKLPHPTTVKGIRSFLGHAGFYRRFIKDFSKISRPMTHLLEKNSTFIFSNECIQAFRTLKEKLTEAPILIAPNWDQPFELMCDASDFAVGAVLRQRIKKHFRPIHYASKTMTQAESNYMTTEKVMLAVVYAFEKFRSYLIMNKSVVYTDHSALKYLFAKKDAKARKLSTSSQLATVDPLGTLQCQLHRQKVDYLSKWVEAKALPTNDARVVVKILKSLFSRFGTPKAIISDKGTHFCNDQFTKVMSKYGVTHRLLTAYHPQTSGQVEVTNRGLKRILERTVCENCALWSDKLKNALWAFRTTFKTPIGCTLYRLVYGKSCHLPLELEHKAFWALKHANFDLKTAADHRKLQLNELQDQAYENSLIYKERTEKLHDEKIKNRIFNVGDQYPDVHIPSQEMNEEKLLGDLKELAEYGNSQSMDRSNFLNNNEDHSDQNKESLENSSKEIATLNSNEEKEEPPQNSNIRQLIREECCVEASEEQKQSMEDTMLELVKICCQKEIFCIYDNVDDLIESALNTKLLSINSQRLEKEKHEVKEIVEQPAERGNQPEYSPSMGYENPNTTPKTESDEIIKSGGEELVPILSENEVTSEDKRECDVPVYENSTIYDDHSDFKIDDDISSDDDDFEDVEYVEASIFDPEIVSVEEDNFCFKIEPDQERLINVVKSNISDDSSNDSLLEEADLFLAFDNSIPPGIKNFADDSKGDIYFLKELLIDDSIPFPNNESSDSNFEDNPSVQQPPPEPPDAEFNAGKEIPVVMNDKDKDVDYSSFISVIYPEMFSLLLSAESEDTIFVPGISD
nr:hypothetical protein [Tanacetum cinerariifolium]